MRDNCSCSSCSSLRLATASASCSSSSPMSPSHLNSLLRSACRSALWSLAELISSFSARISARSCASVHASSGPWAAPPDPNAPDLAAAPCSDPSGARCSWARQSPEPAAACIASASRAAVCSSSWRVVVAAIAACAAFDSSAHLRSRLASRFCKTLASCAATLSTPFSNSMRRSRLCCSAAPSIEPELSSYSTRARAAFIARLSLASADSLVSDVTFFPCSPGCGGLAPSCNASAPLPLLSPLVGVDSKSTRCSRDSRILPVSLQRTRPQICEEGDAVNVKCFLLKLFLSLPRKSADFLPVLVTNWMASRWSPSQPVTLTRNSLCINIKEGYRAPPSWPLAPPSTSSAPSE
mmetsp:Transcript_22637/g.63376  ORF Transcript_22637/g.63376 Transcript_22637/m.63376 type:complete len:352 (-) Transcript_22637:821-1876(-)